MTGKEFKESFEKYMCVIKIEDERFYVVEWGDLQRMYRSKTVIIMFSGNVLTDNMNVYHTFSVHPQGENFDPFSVAISVNN